jgi:hypothetical protein
MDEHIKKVVALCNFTQAVNYISYYNSWSYETAKAFLEENLNKKLFLACKR